LFEQFVELLADEYLQLIGRTCAQAVGRVDLDDFFHSDHQDRAEQQHRVAVAGGGFPLQFAIGLGDVDLRAGRDASFAFGLPLLRLP